MTPSEPQEGQQRWEYRKLPGEERCVVGLTGGSAFSVSNEPSAMIAVAALNAPTERGDAAMTSERVPAWRYSAETDKRGRPLGVLVTAIGEPMAFAHSQEERERLEDLTEQLMEYHNAKQALERLFRSFRLIDATLAEIAALGKE